MENGSPSNSKDRGFTDILTSSGEADLLFIVAAICISSIGLG